MVALAAAVWKLSYEETEQRLRRTGLPALASKKHREAYLSYRAKLTQFNEVYTAGLAATRKGTATGDLAVRVVRGRPARVETWQAGPGKLLATITADQLKTLKNRGWLTSNPVKGKHAVILPAYDLPGRVCALTLGWQNKDRDDWRHVALPDADWSAPDAGLCFHPDLRPWERTDEVLAVPCVPAVPHLIHRYSNTYAGTAPIVGFTANHEIETTNAWQMLKKAKVYMWVPQLTAAYVRQMWLANACVFLWNTADTMDGMMSYLAGKETYLMLHTTVMTKAVAWPTALAQAAARIPVDVFDDAIVGANLPREAYKQLLASWPEFLRNRLAPKLETPEVEPESSARVNYTEINDKLYRVGPKKEQLLCSAIIEVDTIVHSQSDSVVRYEGHVRHAGKRYPFAAPAVALEYNTGRWLQGLLLEHNAGPLLHTARISDLMTTFLQMHPPKSVIAVSRIGWNRKSQRLDLPRFSILPGGEIRPHRLAVEHAYPAETWITPQPLTPAEMQEVTGQNSAQFWGLAAATIANVLRPYWQESQQPVALGCEMIPNSVWKALGCLPGSLKEHKHGWPRAILQKTVASFCVWATANDADRNCIIPLDWWSSRLTTLACQNALRCNGDRLDSMHTILEQVGPYLLTNYLQDLATRDFELVGSGATIPRLLGDMANWAHRNGGYAENVLAGEAQLLFPNPGSTLQTIGELYAKLFLSQKVDMLRLTEAVKRGRAPVIWKQDEVAALPVSALMSASRRHRVPEPVLGSVAEALQPFELPTIYDDHDTYWQVPWAWFRKFFPNRIRNQLVTN